MNANVEIFKENADCLLSVREMELITEVSPKYSYNSDYANEILCFALSIDRDTAEGLVDQLNEIVWDDEETTDHNSGLWYLGDEDEEYVFVY